MKSKSIEIAAAAENLGTAKAFIGKRLKRSNISKEIQAETLMVFDSLFRNILRQGFDKDTLITIKTGSSLGETDIRLEFEGKPYSAGNGRTGSEEEDAVLREYEDKLSCSYQYGYNSIRIAVQRSVQNALFANAMLMIGAPVTFFSLLKNFMDIYVINHCPVS